jgi:broad specificity phosphatase PhoE
VTRTGAVYVARHGETEWSRTGRHTGRTDVPLEEAGHEQAARLAERVAGLTFPLVLYSPLARAADTCRLAWPRPGAEPTDDLVEWDYGEYEGLSTEEIRQRRPGWDLFADGVPGGETAAEVGRRVDRVIERARAVDGDTLCFAHAHVLRVMAARWVGLPPAAGRLLTVAPGSLGILGWERENPVITCWSEQPAPPR